MNYDIHNKDVNIKSLVEYLFQKYGDDKFKIKDYWVDDDCAIGLIDASEKYLIYVSTIGLDKTGYFVSLENPSKDEEFPYEPGGEFDNLSLAELENIFINHLHIDK